MTASSNASKAINVTLWLHVIENSVVGFVKYLVYPLCTLLDTGTVLSVSLIKVHQREATRNICVQLLLRPRVRFFFFTVLLSSLA